jgi:hypothetical protein
MLKSWAAFDEGALQSGQQAFLLPYVSPLVQNRREETYVFQNSTRQCLSNLCMQSTTVIAVSVYRATTGRHIHTGIRMGHYVLAYCYTRTPSILSEKERGKASLTARKELGKESWVWDHFLRIEGRLDHLRSRIRLQL